MDHLTIVAEGLNAITDNARSWTPAQIATHAQDLRLEVEAAGREREVLIAALRRLKAMTDQLAIATGI